MADYVVEFTGRNNLSQAAQGVKKDLEGINNEASKAKEGVSAYDAFAARFEKITNSTKPLKSQLGSLKRLLADMNMSEAFDDRGLMTQVAAKAGAIKDAITDANDAVNRFSSDTMMLNASIQAFQLGAAGATALTGAMGLLGVESEKAQQMILKVQSALAILNGVQTVANILNKDSVFMHTLKAQKLKVLTAVQAANNAVEATGNNLKKTDITLTAAQAAKTAVATSAQNAWNVAKAVGMAMLGNMTGLLLLGVAGITAYALATAGAAEEVKGLTEAEKGEIDGQRKFRDAMSSTYAELMGSYTRLRIEWRKLSSDAERTQWIKGHKTEFSSLGLTIESVADAERALVSNTADVIASFVRKAKAAAIYSRIVDAYRKQMELSDDFEGKKTKAGDRVYGNVSYNAKDGLYSIGNDGHYYYTEKGAAKANKGPLDKIKAQQQAIQNQIDSDLKTYESLMGDIKPALQAADPTTPKATPKTTPKETVEDVKAVEGSISDMQSRLKEMQDSLRNGFIPTESIGQTMADIESLKARIESEEIRLGFRNDVKAEELERIKAKLEEAFGNIEFKPSMSSFDAHVRKQLPRTLDEALSEIERQMDFNDSLAESLETLRQKYEELGLTGTETYKRITEALKATSAEQEKLGGTAENLDTLRNKNSRLQASMETTSSVASSTSSAFTALGQAASSAGSSEAAAALQMVSSVSQAVSDIIPQIMALITAKQADAMASGVQGAAKVPYPANIAAIASIVATIVGTFASIISIASRAKSSYNSGGIIGGSGRAGYEHPILAHRGEIVLNERQQRNLFDAIDKNRLGGGFQAGTVVGRVKGRDIELVMVNNKKSKAKAGLSLNL